MSDAPSEEGVDGILVWTAVRVGRRLERMAANRLAPHGVTPMQFGVLVYVGSRPGMTQSALARVVEVRPQSVRETVTALRDRGLLEPGGGRGPGQRSALRLTDEGYALLARTWPVVAGIDAAAVGLAPGDDVVLNRLMHRVLRR